MQFLTPTVAVVGFTLMCVHTHTPPVWSSSTPHPSTPSHLSVCLSVSVITLAQTISKRQPLNCHSLLANPFSGKKEADVAVVIEFHSPLPPSRRHRVPLTTSTQPSSSSSTHHFHPAAVIEFHPAVVIEFHSQLPPSRRHRVPLTTSTQPPLSSSTQPPL